MGIRWSDIPDEAPVATQGVRWSDIPDAPQQGVRWSDITETVEPEPEGRLTKLVRESIEAPRRQAETLQTQRVGKIPDLPPKGFTEEDEWGIGRARAVYDQLEGIQKEEQLERESIKQQVIGTMRGKAYKHLGGLAKIARGVAQGGLTLHEKIEETFGSPEYAKSINNAWHLLDRPTDYEVSGKQIRDRDVKELIKKGDYKGAAAYVIGDEVSSYAQSLIILQALPKVSAIPGMASKGLVGKAALKATHLNAVRIATWNFLTSPGTAEERLKGALTTYGYMMTPAVSGPVAGAVGGGKVLAVSMDFALNSGISGLIVDAYPEALAEAKQMAIDAGDTEPGDWTKHIIRTQAPATMIADLFSSLGTRPTAGAKVGADSQLIDIQTKGVDGIMRQWDQESQVRDATATQFVEPSAGTIPLLGQRPAGESPQAYRNVLNKQIRDTVVERGISKDDLKEIKGYSKDSPEATLQLARRWRPKKLHGVKPIDSRTEKKLESLMGVLGATDQLGREQMAKIIVDNDIQGPPRFVDRNTFMTEVDAKKLLGILNSEAGIYGDRIAMEKAMPPDVRRERDARKAETQRTAKAQVESGKKVKVSDYWTEDLMWNEMEKKTGEDFHTSYVDASDARLDAIAASDVTMNRLEAVPGFEMSRKSPASQDRIRDIVRGRDVKVATPQEYDQAAMIRQMLDDDKPLVQENRFMHMYDTYKGDVRAMFNSQYRDSKTPPDISMPELEAAVKAYEAEGIDALRALIAKPETTWGVIDNNYSPETVFNPSLDRRPPSMRKLADGHLNTKSGIEFNEDSDRTYFQQLNGLFKQNRLHQALRPHVAHISHLWDRTHKRFEKPDDMKERITMSLNGMKGFSQLEGRPGARRFMANVYSAMFWDVKKWVRNYIQPEVLYPWRRDFLNPRNRAMKLSQEDVGYFNRRVSQNFGITKDQMYGDEKPLRVAKAIGVSKLQKLANATSQYPASDQLGRMRTFKAAKNRAVIALEKNPDDISQAARDMRLDFLEDTEQARAFEEYAKGGPQAMARYFGAKVADRVHFIYDRSRRAGVEQKGGVLSNLLTFPRSYTERLLLQGRKVLNKTRGSHKARLKAANDIFGVLTAGWLIGSAFKEITGTNNNPYSPLNIIAWTPGGLTLGIADEWGDTMWNMTKAIQGDERALDAALVGIARMHRHTVPMANTFWNSLEAMSDTKNLDLMALRKLREMIDQRYDLDPDTHEMEREFIDAIRHGAFGTEPGKKREE